MLAHLTGAPNPAGTLARTDADASGGTIAAVPMRQGDISEWFQTQINTHKARTSEWQASKGARLEVLVAAHPSWLDNTWSAEPAVDAAVGTITTISSLKLRSPAHPDTPCVCLLYVFFTYALLYKMGHCAVVLCFGCFGPVENLEPQRQNSSPTTQKKQRMGLFLAQRCELKKEPPSPSHLIICAPSLLTISFSNNSHLPFFRVYC